jgi:anti-sigma-K factor RskA
MNKHIDNDQDELTWRAFQYVAGELSATDADLFEERLADDQSAREAVAQAVALFHTVCAVEAAEPAVALAGQGSRRAVAVPAIVWRGALAVAAAILLAITLNLNLFNRSTPESKNVAAVTPALADAWSALRADFASDENASQSVAASAVLTDAELAIAEEDLAVSTDAPSWMTAAVLGLSGKAPQPLDAVQPQPQEN